jgi:hypothetical protein
MEWASVYWYSLHVYWYLKKDNYKLFSKILVNPNKHNKPKSEKIIRFVSFTELRKNCPAAISIAKMMSMVISIKANIEAIIIK